MNANLSSDSDVWVLFEIVIWVFHVLKLLYLCLPYEWLPMNWGLRRHFQFISHSLIGGLMFPLNDERDHAGGNENIKQLVPGIKVYGGSLDKVKGCTDAVDNGDKLSLGQDVNILALHTPWLVLFSYG